MLDANFITAKQIRLTQGFIDQMLLKFDIVTPTFNQDDLVQVYSLIDLSSDYATLMAYLVSAMNTKKAALETEFGTL